MMEFSPPHSLTALYKITTPMFLGGESQQADSQQFRNASFKGALRFWWRALNWGRVLNQAHGNTADALKALHDQEGTLFGLASDGKNSRQSMVSIHSNLSGAALKEPGMALQRVGYLLGRGLFNFGDGVTRQYLEGGDLAIRLNFKPGMAEPDIQSVEQAAIALGLFGGMGSRSRRGLGSLALLKLERQGQPVREFATVESIAAFIQTLDFSAPVDAPLSAFTRATRIDVSATAGKAVDALAAIGNEMQLYRGYGRHSPRTNQHEVNGQKARQQFSEDHHNVLAAVEGARLQQLPTRAVFGLPHNYFFSSIKEGDNSLDLTVRNPEPSGQETDGRRASPLLVHIHPLHDGQFIAIQTLLPEVFLPQGVGLSAKVGIPKKKKRPVPAPQDTTVDYAVITRYLDGFASKKTLKAPQHG